MVLYPNGRWRRECRTGFYFSYPSACGSLISTIMQRSTARGRGMNNELATGDYDVTTRNRLLGRR